MIEDRLALVDFPQPAPEIISRPSTMPREALRVLDLEKNFRSGFLRKPIRGINGVSFTVTKGEVFALLGHNGAGKTTTINCILDLVHPDGGEVRIFDKPGTEIQSRAKVGYLPERPYFFEHLTGRELLEFYGKLLSVAPEKKNIQMASLLEKTGMSEAADRPLRKYSKGMLQRIGLAQALLGEPDLLILDEPMSGLDPIGRREVRQLLQELKAEGKTIILSSHIVPDVEVLADTVGIMCEGQLVETCDMAKLATRNSYEVRVKDEYSPAGHSVLNAADVNGLGRILEECRSSGRVVLSVDTKRTGLEDLFMQVHAKREAV
jgi:ABC-2 type transport system ATP-binding protein